MNFVNYVLNLYIFLALPAIATIAVAADELMMMINLLLFTASLCTKMFDECFVNKKICSPRTVPNDKNTFFVKQNHTAD